MFGQTIGRAIRKCLAEIEGQFDSYQTVPRQYQPVPNEGFETHVFPDASEKAIAAVAYLRSVGKECSTVGFVLEKSKVAPKSGLTIPRLELCAAVLAVEVGEIVSEHLGVEMRQMTFYSDSRVVLGYLNNKSRRFYVYVQNIVYRILSSTSCQQWHYVTNEENLANQGTRPMLPQDIQDSHRLNGPDLLTSGVIDQIPKEYKFSCKHTRMPIQWS